MSISEDLLKKEDLRSHLFRETWQNLIPEVFRDVPSYYDKGNAVASLGNCSRWSNTFATAIHRHLPHGACVLDVCSGTHDIALRLFAIDPTLQVHAVDRSEHMTAEGQRRARERNLTIRVSHHSRFVITNLWIEKSVWRLAIERRRDHCRRANLFPWPRQSQHVKGAPAS